MQPEWQRSTAWAKPVAALAFVLLALVTWQSAGLGSAGLQVHLANRETERLKPAPFPADREAMRRATDHLVAGLRHAPGNPWALEGLGMMALRTMRSASGKQQAVAAARDARRYFREALRERPVSPYLWSSLALSKLYLEEFDEEFYTALRHAGELGPWEPGIQQAVVFMGLRAWDGLDSGLRKTLAGAVERSAHRNADAIYRIVKSYGRFDLLCDNDRYRKLVGPDCRIRPADIRPPLRKKPGP